MKVISLMGDHYESLLHISECLAQEFSHRGIKLGLFIEKNEQDSGDGYFFGNVVRYKNKTNFEVNEAFDLDRLMRICYCDFLMAINLSTSHIPKVLVSPYEETFKKNEEILCMIHNREVTHSALAIPVFNYDTDISALVSYLWLNSIELVSSKNIKLDEEFVQYADTARKNVAVVKIKSKYGYELPCIKKIFSSHEGASREAFYAGILNTTIKVYPQIIDVVNKVLYREFVDGSKLNEVVEEYTFDHGERSFYYLESILLSIIDTINFIHNELADYYGEAYTIGNTDFENFLIADDTVYYLDLTGFRKGDCINDFEQFLAHILSCDFIKTNDKRQLINGMIQYVNNSFSYKRELKWDGIERAFKMMTFDM